MMDLSEIQGLPELAELAPDGVVVVDREGRVIGFNTAVERITGLAHGEAVGRACEEVLGEAVGRLVRQVLGRGEVLANLELPLPTPEGEVLVWATISSLRDVKGGRAGAVVTMRDIGEVARLAEELYERQGELLREKQKLEAILESIADGVFTVDGDWRVASFNRAAEEITGFSRKEVAGLPCERVFQSSTCRGMCPLRRAFAIGGPVYDVEVEITRKDGRRVPISVSAAPLRDADGVVIGGVEVFRDLSALRQLSRELEERYSFGQIIGKSKLMRELFALLENVAETDSTVLIYGESGTGKELVARALHYNGPRKEGHFVPVNCAALPEALLESELFGYERGAFTGATRSKPGR
ncbi:MAG TPA: PAS domain S-box protein, partial [Candidatus Latescibacteria bacterium]|nr:PAS domain S-box protein [Candidatus Latescibacterota bacterium]